MPEPVWYKNCSLCNAGLVNEVDESIERGDSQKSTFKRMSGETGGVYTPEQIKRRYKYHKGGTICTPQDRIHTPSWQSVANRLKSLIDHINKNCVDAELPDDLAGEIAGYISIIRAYGEDFIIED